MNAPLGFMLAPVVLAVLAYGLGARRGLATGTVVVGALVLALAAWFLPIGERGPFGLLLQDTWIVLGRRFVLAPDVCVALTLMFLQAGMLFGASAVTAPHRFYLPIGCLSLGVLTAALLVQPFVFAALFLELAAALAVMLLVDDAHPTTRGALRFLVFMTLGMLCVLVTGWLFEAIAANPGDAALTLRGTLMLALGFAIWLGVAPFQSGWPSLAQHASPLAVAFVFSVMRTPLVFLLLRFLQTYPWLNQNPSVARTLTVVGGGLALLGALFVFSQRNFGRSLGYAMLSETGALLLTLGLGAPLGAEIVLASLVLHGLALMLWALGRSDLQGEDFDALRGLGRRRPLATALVVVSLLSLAGFPLTAGFVARWALLNVLAQVHPTSALFLLAGTASMGWVCARGLAALLTPVAETQPTASTPARESPLVIGIYSLGLILLLALGVFPQWLMPILTHAAQRLAITPTVP